MDVTLDGYFPMQYVLHAAEKGWGSQGAAWAAAGENVYYAMFDCPYTYPTGLPWSGMPGGASVAYYAADFKHNGPTSWMAYGADTNKIGIGLNSGGVTLASSSGSTVPGDKMAGAYPGYVTYSACLAAGGTYVAEVDMYWGYVGGLYTTWIDSAGAYKRTKWAVDTLGMDQAMIYDIYSDYISTGNRLPHIDAMIKAMSPGGGGEAEPPVSTRGHRLMRKR
jgi:hypothetical protein